MKTYIISVWYDLFGSDAVKILYVGNDEHKAFNMDVSKYVTAEIEIWENEQMIEEYYRNYSSDKWAKI